ncbi:MAG: pitrilysin family protein [Planctomycetota bacterium]
MDLITHQSSDGPEIVVLNDPEAFTSSFGCFVKTGARDEHPEIAGVSHFLEHMVFKGTGRRSAEEVNRELDHLGAQSNAFTSEDSTVFYASVLPECQEHAVDLLTDLMQPTLDEEEFEMEKQVVLEEIAMYDDQPPYGAFERATEIFFGEHPLATRVLGTVETVADLSVQQMRDYHAQRYTQDNLYFVACGKVDVPRLIEQVSSLAASWPKSSSQSRVAAPEFQSGEELLTRDLAHQSYMVRLWPGLKANDPDRYALRMLCSILADDSGSRLFWELIDTGKAETASLWPQMFDDCGCVAGYLCCAPEDAEANEAILERVIQDIAERGVSEKEIELSRNKIEAGLILSDERPSNRLFALGQSWLARQNYEPIDVVLSRYRSVSAEDIRRVAQTSICEKSVAVRVQGEG